MDSSGRNDEQGIGWLAEALAVKRLGKGARPGKRIGVCGGVVEVWRAARQRTHKRANYWISPDGNLTEISANWESFSAMIREGGALLSDFEEIAILLEYGPGRRLIALEAVDVPEAYRGTKWTPQRESNRVVFHGVEAVRGVWQQISVYDDCRVEELDLGPAPTFGFR